MSQQRHNAEPKFRSPQKPWVSSMAALPASDCVNASLFHYLCCPSCGFQNLTLTSSEPLSEGIIQGFLSCRICSTTYPVVDNIPRFVSSENYSQSFGFQWNIHAQTQLDSHTGCPLSQKRLLDAAGWPADLSGQLILEADCGAGRFTECLLKTGATVVSFDYSAAVDSNARNNAHSERLFLFQGDMRNLPLPHAMFDKVLCLGVLQHTPSPHESFACLSEMVRPGGELVVDLYRKSILALLQWKYVLRPITRRMDHGRLYRIISRVVPLLLPAAKKLRRMAGRTGARLIPIVEYSHLGLPLETNKHWAILDTFDMYAPAHDHPQTMGALNRWFNEAGFTEVSVRPGPNGMVGKGRRPKLGKN
jgi:2-polyprenyl-3-methyl-5-hydroxy-6-metoxy-1,4-benzoquinol methylase